MMPSYTETEYIPNSLDNINDPITKRAIKKFNADLMDEHRFMNHDVMPIPKGYSQMDCLCHIFDNDAMAIADVLQSYVDNNQHAVGLLGAIHEGIRTKSICITCIRQSVGLNRS